MSYAYKIDGRQKVKLSEYDPQGNGGLTKEQAEQEMAGLGREMAELNDMLFAAGTHSLLIVLQGRDTSGKDGLIRSLLSNINAQSCHVVPFKEPSTMEVAHDFLWRIHEQVPGKGSIALFNRSHYEDVLVVRVHNLVPEEVWRRRYDHINNFESLLTDANTIILKFYLHISEEEQKQRLLDREKDPTKAWKLAVSDWRERECWADYTKAYEEALQRCSSPALPWYIVPANRKWFRNIAVTEQIVKALRPYRDDWMKHLEQLGKTATAELIAYRKEHGM